MRKKFSAERAAFELLKKGIDRDLIDEILEEAQVDPVEQIVSVIERKYIRSISDEKGRNRAINGLRAMGYRWDDIKEALRNFEEYED